jgi:hypothetical protein
MNKFNRLHRLVFLMIAVMTLASLPNMQASAAFRKCRTDPIFKLSNGDVINITLDINADESAVRNVSYVLHVPAGVTVTKVTYTAGGIGKKETYKVYQDSPANTYTTDTHVTTQNTGSVAMTATTRLNGVYARSASGLTGQHLIVTVARQ